MHPTSLPKAARLLAILAMALVCLSALPAVAADYYVTDQSSSYIDFSGSGVGPGDTIYLVPHTRARLALKNLAGTAENPITVTNYGGQFVLYNPNDDYETLRLINCQHVILRGTPGEGYDYGIKVTNLPSTGKVGLYVVTTPTDIEIDSIEIGPVGGAGIMAKDEAATPPLVFDNLIVHDCYVHDVGNEGMYLGSSNFSSGEEEPLHNCHVYNNIVMNTGWDAIQVGCGTVNTRIHDNVCIGYGSDSEKTVQNDGIRGNPGFSGEIYNNYIQCTDAAGRSGMNINAWDDTYVYNNVIVDAGSDGIKFLDDVGSPVTDCDVVIANNTIIEPAGDGIEYWPDAPVGLAINNIIVNPGDNYVYHRYTSVDLTETTNLEAATVGSVGFTDAANDDYSLSSSATGAIDQGTDVSSYGVTFDFDNESRPYNGYYDIGAYEYLGGGEPTNQTPYVNAGSDDSITLPTDTVNLDGTVTDDGLPDPPASVTTLWTKTSGPGTVTFGNDAAVDTTATFSTDGVYVLRLTADDSSLQAYDEVTITVNPVPSNQAPSVDAGSDDSITLPTDTVSLDGTVSDDGLPNPPATVTTLWTKTSGPGTVTFGNDAAVDTTATFSTDGVYVLRLTADDSSLQAYDEVTITVNPVANQAPTVDAGEDQSVLLANGATLDGTVSDDGLPNPPAAVTTLWTVVSMPGGGSATFADASSVDTTVSFGKHGTYVLRLTADDSALQTSDDITITVAKK